MIVVTLALPAGAEPVRFNRDVLPILADQCFSCHGPDRAKHEANVRLDREDGARKVPSELVRGVTSNDPEERMPPKASGRELTPAQVETLRRWVAEGGRWGKHWAFVPPVRPEPPAV